VTGWNRQNERVRPASLFGGPLSSRASAPAENWSQLLEILYRVFFRIEFLRGREVWPFPRGNLAFFFSPNAIDISPKGKYNRFIVGLCNL
jgi:hypothetical protein